MGKKAPNKSGIKKIKKALVGGSCVAFAESFELTEVEPLDAWAEAVGDGGKTYAIGDASNGVFAIHLLADGTNRDRIFIKGVGRYPVFGECAAAASLLDVGSMWVIAPEPNERFMVAVLDFSQMVETGTYDMVKDFLATVANVEDGLFISHNDLAKYKATESGGYLMIEPDMERMGYKISISPNEEEEG